MEIQKRFFLLAGRKQHIITAAEVFILFLAFKLGKQRRASQDVFFFPLGVRRKQKKENKCGPQGRELANGLLGFTVNRRSVFSRREESQKQRSPDLYRSERMPLFPSPAPGVE